MSENNRSDCFSSEMTVEERLALRALREEALDLRRVDLGVRSYRTVDEYDAVLRAHCRLEEEKAKGPRMDTDARG